jgi:hypothetical protein
MGCKALKTIVIPERVTEIDEHAFDSSGIETITIPASVRSIGKYAFWGADIFLDHLSFNVRHLSCG